ncbi:MAG: type I-G CRISPR-associated RAMP protein Csb1/Cas7g [Acidimicrobiales bacterium]
MTLSPDTLLAACGDDADEAGLLLTAELQPLGGPGTPVKPATYAGGSYQRDRRWVGEDGARQVADVVVIDNPPSQANRLEAQLERLAADLGLPNLVLDLAGHPLPAHLSKTLSAFRFPHRSADAYLRDSTLDGVDFSKTDLGRRIRDATADNPSALLEWFPQALVFGFWQSHLGKKGSQAKLARSWVSEIIGIRPATDELRVLGVKGDPLNLSGDDRIVFDEDDHSQWELREGEKKSTPVKGQKAESLSRIGHGQVPFKESELTLGPLSFERVVQHSSLSFAALRRVWVGSPRENAAARALLVALGLVAHTAAFGRPFSLRSGCELRAKATTWTWLGGSADVDIDVLDVSGASALFHAVVGIAETAGLPVGTHWRTDPLVLRPNVQLSKAIAATYPVVD